MEKMYKFVDGVEVEYSADDYAQYEQDVIAEENRRLASLPIAIRNKRTALLKESDWTQYPDSPLNVEQKQEWAIYRQALRDITSQSGFPTDVQFPDAPNQGAA
jgi:hypothetical protein